MGKASIINPLSAMLGPKHEDYDGRCKLPGCKERQVKGLVVCDKHRLKAEQDFYAQIGLDPLFHMKHDVSTFPEWNWIYFVGSREHGIVKIGRTSRLKHRMSNLRNSAPVPVKLFAVVFGDPAIEKVLHELFAKSRQHGEWFKLTDDISECIDDIKNQRFAKYIPMSMIPDRTQRIERALKGMAESVLMRAEIGGTLEKLGVARLCEK